MFNCDIIIVKRSSFLMNEPRQSSRKKYSYVLRMFQDEFNILRNLGAQTDKSINFLANQAIREFLIKHNLKEK